MKWNALLMSALLALGATACSKDDGSEGEGEPEATATAAASEQAERDDEAAEAEAEESADEGSGKERMAGTWVLDEKTVKEMMKKNEAEAGSKKKGAQGLGMAMVMAMAPTMEFKEDGTYEFTMQNPMKKDAEPKTETGAWEVANQDGDMLTLKTESEEGEEEKVTATFDGDDRLTFEKGGEKMKMYLKRQS